MRQALVITLLWVPLAAVGFVPAVFGGFVLETEPAGFFQWLVAWSMQAFPLVCAGCVGAGWVLAAVHGLVPLREETAVRVWRTLLLAPAVPLILWGGGWLGLTALG